MRACTWFYVPTIICVLSLKQSLCTFCDSRPLPSMYVCMKDVHMAASLHVTNVIISSLTKFGRGGGWGIFSWKLNTVVLSDCDET